MLSCPRHGQRVRIRYGKPKRAYMPLHDKSGTVRIVSRGRPRNHGVEIAGVLYAIPAGNLIAEESS